jgi:hypothetical protein
MPKPVKKKQKRTPPSDINQWARHMVEQSTADPEPDQVEPPAIDPTALSAYMSALGRKGGHVGGKRRLITMTQAERTAVALKGARARWKKAKRRVKA